MWADCAAYRQAYPTSASTLSSEQYAELARQAETLINVRTHYMARSASTEAELTILGACQMALVQSLESEEQEDIASEGRTGLLSANNSGYSETYASAEDMRAYRLRVHQGIIQDYLSAPETAWMLYQGGVFHT